MASGARTKTNPASSVSLKPISSRPSKVRKDPGTDDEDDSVLISDVPVLSTKPTNVHDKRAREEGTATKSTSSGPKRHKLNVPHATDDNEGADESQNEDDATESAKDVATTTGDTDVVAGDATSSSSTTAKTPSTTDDKGKAVVAAQGAPTLTHVGTALPTHLQTLIGELQTIYFYDRLELFEKYVDIDLFEILAIVRGGNTEWDDDDKATYGLHKRDISKCVFQSKLTGGQSTGKPAGAYLSFGERKENTKDKSPYIDKIKFSIPMFTATAIYTGLNTEGMANDNSRSPLFLLIGSTTLPHKIYEGEKFNDAIRFLLRVQQALINGWAITLGILCKKILELSFSEEHRATSWPAAVFLKLDGKVRANLGLRGPAAEKYTPTAKERLEEFLKNEAKCGFLPGKDGESCLISIKRRLVRPPSKKEKETLQKRLDEIRLKMGHESLDHIPVADRILSNDPKLCLPNGTPLPVVAENIKRNINGVLSLPKVRKPVPRTKPGAPKPRPELWPIPDPIEGIPRKSIAPSLVTCQNVSLEFSIKSVDEFSKAMGSILSWNPYSDGHELNVETVLPKIDRGHDMKLPYDYEAMTGCSINAFDEEDYDDYEDHDATAIH